MTITPDAFPCLLLVTDMETNAVEYANHYACQLLGRNKNAKYDLSAILSKASSILFESYMTPLLVSNKECSEIQITLVLADSEKVPVVANVTLHQTKLYWSLYTAIERDTLYQELLTTRERLEERNEELVILTRTDPLTSLLNRRAALVDFAKVAEQLNRVFIPLSFLIIDIDWFKIINDNHGHDVGDKVLVKLSEHLKASSRESDILARWGGEEFLLILYNTGIDDSKSLCDRLHHSIKMINLPDAEGFTISIGLTTLKKDEVNKNNTLDNVLKRADKALYRAKENGRNRTEIIL